jgi:hypothetical protein
MLGVSMEAGTQPRGYIIDIKRAKAFDTRDGYPSQFVNLLKGGGVAQ